MLMDLFSRRQLRYVLLIAALQLSGCGGGSGGSKDTPNTPVPAPAPAAQPIVTLSGTPDSVTAGSGTTLNWNSTNATSCTASGGWSGPRGTSGTEAIAALSQTT